MAEIAIHNVRDLGEDARRALEALLGRQLAEEEQVGVTALAARPAPTYRRWRSPHRRARRGCGSRNDAAAASGR